MLTYDTREVMRENAHNLVEILILEQVPFRIVLWNNDNWDNDLPDDIMENFPVQLVLDIKDMALEESFIDEATGEIIIATMFNGHEYVKALEYDEIIAILDLDGQPYCVNNFPQEDVEPDIIEEHYDDHPKTKKELIELATINGLEKVNVERSINCFLKNNPELAERYK